MNQIKDDSKHLGKWFIFVAWIIGIAMLAWFFHAILVYENRDQASNVRIIEQDGRAQLILTRNRQGHYISKGSINGHKVTFMLDTGATIVAIPGNIAKKIGIKDGIDSLAQTAGGVVKTYTTFVDELTLGPFIINKVNVSVTPTLNSDMVLLGMNVLKQLSFTQTGDELILYKE